MSVDGRFAGSHDRVNSSSSQLSKAQVTPEGLNRDRSESKEEEEHDWIDEAEF